MSAEKNEKKGKYTLLHWYTHITHNSLTSLSSIILNNILQIKKKYIGTVYGPQWNVHTFLVKNINSTQIHKPIHNIRNTSLDILIHHKKKIQINHTGTMKNGFKTNAMLGETYGVSLITKSVCLFFPISNEQLKSTVFQHGYKYINQFLPPTAKNLRVVDS